VLASVRQIENDHGGDCSCRKGPRLHCCCFVIISMGFEDKKILASLKIAVETYIIAIAIT
jgi:hypothetical protein